MSYSILNYDKYNKSMASSIKDKCWWVDLIPTNIDTVIDYGCATGELFDYIHSNFKGRFIRFIGIDNNNEMLNNARKRNIPNAVFYNSINDIDVDGKRTIIIFNSVLHEILTYDGKASLEYILSIVKKKEISVVAVRDMFYSGIDYETRKEIEKFYKSTKKPSSWKSHIAHCRFKNKSKLLQEYILKYRYNENWEREVREQYLWNWYFIIKNNLSNYFTVRNFNFRIPEQIKNIKNELGIIWTSNTHKKALFIRL